MTVTSSPSNGRNTSVSDLLAGLITQEVFRPSVPTNLQETGLSSVFLEGLVLKLLLARGTDSGRSIATTICIPFGVLEPVLGGLRSKQVIVHVGSASMGDYRYALTDSGRQRAHIEAKACAYVGPAPVSLAEYTLSAEAQSIAAETPRKEDLEKAFSDISVESHMLDALGPAINSAKGLFLYGAPGNGKTTLARRVTNCFGQAIWVPHAVTVDGLIIKCYDPAYHEKVEEDSNGILRTDNIDTRWVKIRRPTVVVGGELTLDALEVRHDPVSNVSEAPLQMKANCGCLLIDDFGRQRIAPHELLNRWIVPLENQIDYLQLASGKKIQIPFELLVMFSTNLEPKDLVDEAFMRRVPYKIEVTDPSDDEFQKMFQIACRQLGFNYDRDCIEYLNAKHYAAAKRPKRRCHPRDLLLQIRNYCRYKDLAIELRNEYFDRAASTYFTVMGV